MSPSRLGEAKSKGGDKESKPSKRNLKLKAEFRCCLTQSGAKPSFGVHVPKSDRPQQRQKDYSENLCGGGAKIQTVASALRKSYAKVSLKAIPSKGLFRNLCGAAAAVQTFASAL